MDQHRNICLIERASSGKPTAEPPRLSIGVAFSADGRWGWVVGGGQHVAGGDVIAPATSRPDAFARYRYATTASERRRASSTARREAGRPPRLIQPGASAFLPLFQLIKRYSRSRLHQHPDEFPLPTHAYLVEYRVQMPTCGVVRDSLLMRRLDQRVPFK